MEVHNVCNTLCALRLLTSIFKVNFLPSLDKQWNCKYFIMFFHIVLFNKNIILFIIDNGLYMYEEHQCQLLFLN